MPFYNNEDSPERPKRRARNSPRHTRISKQPEERRQEIIETALELFSEKGYENTTIQDISDRMNVSPGLCYRYFKSKTEIFAATSEYYAMKAVEQINVPVAKDTPALEKLSLFIHQIFEYVMKHKEFEANYHEETEIRASRLDHVANEMVITMIPIVEQGISENVFHCKDVQRTTKFLVYGLIHTFHDDISDIDTEDYIILFRGFMQEVFSNILKIENWEL
ncbi:TPA: TetR/AcrR family transcriptional regulator [Clostridioides difficile]|uniref:TetR/AcrR family transcriptional regulator n=1 Tax=Clostridioides difficile TaxID=1496 RepID=UPI0010AFEB32|nr:TetR/AcrR family transcriptional regulator [Clostridioides difficile]MCP8652257.1 TetR/AcrR family transcriptional regulator [Clostridioides difficile]MDM0190840.1 TetR/AcrR family transcriptional regulator [Clostridioides difficile]VIB55468.1 TetR family transcriptional regulator [Clostridioides difficile]HBE9527544.1 TetR/AcrR family transcriptional regulator [Clostridioides difficile]HBF0045302.1 TetR/AcrR family transcriptional regulator [Clostridioides difficile]